MTTVFEKNLNADSKVLIPVRDNNELVNSEAKENDNTVITTNLEQFLNYFDERIDRTEYVSGEKIKVSEVLSLLAKIYEKVRTTIEYKGESVLRRNAIERILKRLSWEKERLRHNLNSNRISRYLIRELIWAGYVKNDYLPVETLLKIENILDKYFLFLENFDNYSKNLRSGDVKSWIWGIASAEIEDKLDPLNKDLFITLTLNWMIERFNWTDKNISDHEKIIQLYLAIHRSLLKSDDAIMRFHLLSKEIPEWKIADRAQIYKFINNFESIYSEIEFHLNYKYKNLLYRIVQKQTPAFEVFMGLAINEKHNLRRLVLDKEQLEEKIRLYCEKKYQSIKTRVRTGIIRSIIYIFISKVILALFLEIPFEIYRYGEIKNIPLLINIGFPPFFMWLIGMSISIPGARNTNLIIDRINSIIFEDRKLKKIPISLITSSRGSLILSLFSVLYALLILLVFTGLSYLLFRINFSVVGIAVFFIFMSLVLLFAYRIRFHSSQMRVESEKQGFLSHLFDYLTLPFLNLGFFLSKALAKINIFTMIFDFLIEAPLKNIIDIFEEWFSYIKERKDEVVEIPE